MSLLFRTALSLAVICAGAAFAQGQPHADDHAGHDHGQATTQAQSHAGHDHGPADQANQQAHDHAGTHPATTPASQPASQPTTAPTGSPETVGPVTNSTCPIMNQPINEQYSVVHEGKTVYFCCAACPAVFNSNPERYVSQLPQFSSPTN